MKITGFKDIVFDIDIKYNNLYDLYVDGEIYYRGINGETLWMKFKHIDPINLIAYQNGSNIYLFKHEGAPYRYCPSCGRKLI